MLVTCAYCGKEADIPTGEVNRAHKVGARLFCNRVCAGLGRRKHKTIAQKKEEKRLYDEEYRKKNQALLKQKKAEYFKRAYDPVKAAEERKKIMPRHVEYCRQPEYREWKREYDKQYRAKEAAGEFWESHVLLVDLTKEILSRMTRTEIYQANNTLNKWKQRRREYDRLNRNQSEKCPLGNA